MMQLKQYSFTDEEMRILSIAVYDYARSTRPFDSFAPDYIKLVHAQATELRDKIKTMCPK